MGRSNPTGHPARFSESIIAYLKTQLTPDMHVHDPFAGTGEFLGALADEIGFRFTGTEIEESFIVDKRVKVGDSTQRKTYPHRFHSWVGCTSMVYPNGVADYFVSSEKQARAWSRNTYRHAVAKLTDGNQTELQTNNMAKFGYRGTQRDGRSERRKAYWHLAERCVGHWDSASRFILNTSDFIHQFGGHELIEPVTEDWQNLMRQHGWSIDHVEYVVTPRYGNASDESRNQRMDSEAVMTFVRR